MRKLNLKEVEKVSGGGDYTTYDPTNGMTVTYHSDFTETWTFPDGHTETHGTPYVPPPDQYPITFENNSPGGLWDTNN